MEKDVLLHKMKYDLVETELELNDIEEHYYVHHVSDTPGISGYIYVKVDEGVLQIPYGDVLVTQGREQLLVDKAEMVDELILLSVLGEIKSFMDGFIKLFIGKGGEKKDGNS